MGKSATKAGAQQFAAKHGMILVFPDTSPRGDDVADDASYALGKGAGFYMTATKAPWADHYKMDSYIIDELTALVPKIAPVASDKAGITGHSMGGHGALTLAMRYLIVSRASLPLPLLLRRQKCHGDVIFFTPIWEMMKAGGRRMMLASF